MYYVYHIKSEIDSTNYIGQTVNVNARLKRHNSGKVISTRNKRPWLLIKFEEYETRSDAMWREHILKTNANERKKFYNS